MRFSLVVAVALAAGGVAVSGEGVAKQGSALKTVSKSYNATATLPTNFDELKAYLAALNAGRVADAKKAGPAAKIAAPQDDESDVTWSDSLLGLAKTAVMTFNDIFGLRIGDVVGKNGLGLKVGDAYLKSLGVTWTNTYLGYLPNEECGNPLANAPTPPFVADFGFGKILLPDIDVKGATEPVVVDASMTSTEGLIKEVSFYYATPSFVPVQIANNPKLVVTKPSVSAWSGPAGTGKKLETKELDWTTGENLYNFVKVSFKFKGVAKSIAVTLPTLDGTTQPGSLYFDNVEIVAPKGKAAVVAAGALEVEEKFDEIEKKFKEPEETAAPVQNPV